MFYNWKCNNFLIYKNIKLFLFVEFSGGGYIVGVFVFVGYCKVIYLFGMF